MYFKTPLVSEMRKIYGRPKLEQVMAASKHQEKNIFIVKRHPFKRLLSGFTDKILHSIKNSPHDRMSRKILEKYRGLPKRKYKHKETVPTFSEFIEYVMDNYEKNQEIDMHWAPVVDFCSVCNVEYTHVLDFEKLTSEFERMLPGLNKTFQNLKIGEVRKNVNVQNPTTSPFIQKNLQSLKPEIYERLCKLYEKDFTVFGYKLPSFEEIKNGYEF